MIRGKPSPPRQETIVPPSTSTNRARTTLAVYADRVNAFSPNARLYLSSVIFLGAAIGVYRLLFNFYVLSLGYDQALLGTLVTTSSLTALIAAMPLGYLIDIIGQKRALIFGASAMAIAIIFMVLFPSAGNSTMKMMAIAMADAVNVPSVSREAAPKLGPY